MTPKQFYLSKSKHEIQEVVSAAKTTFSNFKQIALCGGSVSSKLAERLALSSKYQMTELEILYPGRFDKTDPSVQSF